jgi:hypothetical protein
MAIGCEKRFFEPDCAMATDLDELYEVFHLLGAGIGM